MKNRKEKIEKIKKMLSKKMYLEVFIAKELLLIKLTQKEAKEIDIFVKKHPYMRYRRFMDILSENIRNRS